MRAFVTPPVPRPVRTDLAIALTAVVVLAVNLGLDSYYAFVLGQIALLTLVGVGLNVLLGLSGLMSFGHAGFYAIGAYAVAVSTTRFGVSFWVAWPLGAVLAAAIGALLALPALRLKGPYLAMVTIAFGLIVEHGLVEWSGLTGGQNGILDIAAPRLGQTVLDARGVTALAVLTAVCALLGYRRLATSGWGAAMKAVRDSEVAAASVGLNPTILKTAAFAISASLTALAGGLFAPMAGFVTPQTFNLTQSILFVLVIVIGGAGPRLGPLFGAVAVALLPETLSSFEAYRILAFGVLLMVILWVAPKGVAGLWEAAAPPSPPWAPDKDDGSAVDQALGAALSARRRAPLTATGLGMRFGGVKALDQVSLTLASGRVTALIGPNGAGKSTLMNLLSGFYRPTSGRCFLDKRELPPLDFAVARAGVARSYQTSLLFEGLSVEDNVVLAMRKGRLGGIFSSLRTAEARRRAQALLAACGYRGNPESVASALAHVDRRFVEIARALAMDPDVLLLDEPAAGLSREDKQQLGELVRRIADAGLAVGLIEHDMALVMAVSDSIVVLNAGAQIAQGAPQVVAADPQVRKAYLGEGLALAPRRPAPEVRRLDALRVVNLSASYGAAPVLRGIALEVRLGEAVALLGANGAGKSTLMRVLAGLHAPLTGQVVFDGQVLNGLKPNARVRLGVVLSPEGRRVFPELTVRDNIRLGAFLDPTDIHTRTDAMLARFPRLAERLHQRAGLLSGGEQQMLALARALMSRPRVLLLDEPSLGLAPLVIEEIFAAFRDLRDQDMTLLIVDQMAGLALAVADRAYVLREGAIVAQGASEDLLDDPVVGAAYLGV